MKRNNFFILLLYILPILVAIFPSLSFAQTIKAPSGGPVTDPSSEFTEQLCEFREMFCGNAGVALISITVSFVGILTLMQKINWGFVLIMLTAALVFANADKVAFLVTGEDVSCSCD